MSVLFSRLVPYPLVVKMPWHKKGLAPKNVLWLMLCVKAAPWISSSCCCYLQFSLFWQTETLQKPFPVFFSRAPSPAEDEELGPPPSVDEAADALMTRLGFLLGDKVTAGDPPYHAQDDGQVTKSSLNISLQRRLSVLQSKQISCSYKTTPHTNHNTYILSEVDGNNVHHT